MATIADRYSCYAVIAATVVLYTLTIVLAVWRISTPADSGRLGLQTPRRISHTVTITSAATQDSGLKLGDRVLAVAGQPVTHWAQALLRRDVPTPEWNVGQTVTYTVMREGEILEVPVTLTSYPMQHAIYHNLPTVLFLITLQLPATWILTLRPYERSAQTLFLAASSLVTFSLCWFVYMDLAAFITAPALYLYYRFITTAMIMIMVAALLHFALLLPHLNTNYHIPHRGVQLIYTVPFLYAVVYMVIVYTPDSLIWIRRWEPGLWLLLMVYFAVALTGIIAGYRPLKDPVSRRRVQLVALAYILSTFLAVVIGWVPVWVTGNPWLGWASLPLYSLPVVFSLGIAIVFYRLFDLRIVIQRTLIWSALTAGVIIIYIAIVGTLSAVFSLPENPVFSLIATGIIAVMFNPVRQRLQRAVNRLIYGERDTPYDVIMQLANQLEASLTPEVALETIVQTVAQALKLSYAAIELCQDDRYILTAEYGTPDRVPTSARSNFPLRYGAELAGQLIVAPRTSGESLTIHDHRLIAGLVVHAEGIIQANRLTTDLQWAREKLVRAREEERRRLRRDLHDGLGPNLASLTLQVDAARNALHDDLSKADMLLVELKSQVKDAITTVRTVVYNLRPPSLDELGLVGALQERARKFSQSGDLIVEVDSPTLSELPAAVEGAAYAIALEAITNAARHANATTCSVWLSCTDRLRIEVRDNGKGLSPQHRRGVGIHSMQERAAELGGKCIVENAPEGGTAVIGELPLRLYRLPHNQIEEG